MVPAPCPPGSPSARGRGAELWLLRSGTPGELEERVRAFRASGPALVLSAPGGDEERWAERFARAASASLSLCAELRPPQDGEPAAVLAARVWPVLAAALGAGHGRILAVLSLDVLRASVAAALDLPSPGPGTLRVDPGRAVLLLDEPIGLVLRRSNVLAPEASSGTALPGGRAGGA